MAIENKKLSPYDFINSINEGQSGKNLLESARADNSEALDYNAVDKQYVPFIVNRGLSYFNDSVLFANEMNQRAFLPHKMQYDFLCAVVRKSKRYSKWIKSEEENLEAIQQYFGYSFNKAKEALRILTSDDIEKIKLKLISSKGGKL